MQFSKVLGLAAVGAVLALAAPAERANAMSLSNPGAAAVVQEDAKLATTEVHWRHHRHHHRWHRWHHHHRHHHHRHWRRWLALRQRRQARFTAGLFDSKGALKRARLRPVISPRGQ